MNFVKGHTIISVSLAMAFLSLLGNSATASGGVAFGPPIQVTPYPGKGYEPAVYVDQFGNIFATAHKENWQLVLGPDTNSPTYTRSMSWDWVSTDGGLTFHDLPGLTPASLEQHQFGDEGDMALDDDYHLYFVDTNVTDNTITRWTVTGPGNIKLDLTRPLIPTFQPVDDRPWVTAHGIGHVFYFGNEGDKTTYPLGQGTGNGFGPGRYTVYQSHDAAETFDSFGYTLNDSGWCRPAADHGPNSPYVYAVCNNDGGSNDLTTGVNAVGNIYSYVSADDGHSFSRHLIDHYKALDSSNSWPTVNVSRDGSIWALYVDAGTLQCSTDPTGSTTCNPVNNLLKLYHSTNHGVTWKVTDITPVPGRYRYGSLSISPDGKHLGVGIYYRPDNNSPWHVYGAIWSPGSKPVLTSIDPTNPVASAGSEAPADLMGSWFNPDGTLGVIWTRVNAAVVGVATISRDIFYARSVAAASASTSGGQH
jgi:hypothetical protein